MAPDSLPDRCEFCSVAWKNFKCLTVAELRLVNENRSQATFKAGETIIKQGSPVTHAVFLASGLAKIFIDGQGHKNQILEIVQPSTMIVGPGELGHARNIFSMSALNRVRTCFISLEIIYQLVRQNSEFAAGVITDLSEKTYRSQIHHMNLLNKKMQGRLADAILYFSDVIYHADSFDMILTRQELGEMTNMTKESAVRILRELNSDGIIESGNSMIHILDREKLIMIAEKG